ncbi:MAG: hypothetical protein ACFCVA_14870 [Gammaproteobacteria bacterium]
MERYKAHLTLAGTLLALGFLVMVGCQQLPTQSGEAGPSPTAGRSVSERAQEAAEGARYREIEYTNAAKPGPALVVIPGEVKSTHATFVQKFGPNTIADFAELELSRANFRVLERSDLGPLLNEFRLAYTMGDPEAARKYLQKGRWKTTHWVVRFDVLKAEPVAEQREGFEGATMGSLLQTIGLGSLAGTAVGSVKTAEEAGVWLIGMRYKILDANTTEQVAQGYAEETMEIGAKATSILGVSAAAKGGVTLDTMVQRLVQKSVWEIDDRYK